MGHTALFVRAGNSYSAFEQPSRTKIHDLLPYIRDIVVLGDVDPQRHSSSEGECERE
jgi:hypothetical protein